VVGWQWGVPLERAYQGGSNGTKIITIKQFLREYNAIQPQQQNIKPQSGSVAVAPASGSGCAAATRTTRTAFSPRLQKHQFHRLKPKNKRVTAD
jgi:hypothetical protein